MLQIITHESERTLTRIKPETGRSAPSLRRCDDSCPDVIADQAGELADVQAPHQLGAVRLDRFDAQPEVLRDLASRVAPSDQLKDLVLSRRELGKRSLRCVARQASNEDFHDR